MVAQSARGVMNVFTDSMHNERLCCDEVLLHYFPLQMYPA